MTLGAESLASYYSVNFALQQHHGYNLDTIENMVPWERDIYVGMVANYVREENEKIRLRNKGII